MRDVWKELLLSWVFPFTLSAVALAVTMFLPFVGARDGFFFLFVPAVMLAAWYGGRTAGIVGAASAVLLIDLFMLSPDGSIWILNPSDALLLALFGGVCATIGIVTAGHRRGLVERERALRDAEAARRDAEVSSRLKDQFLATLSHELRTPLNAVLGWTRMLSTRQVDPEKIPAALASIERNAHAQKQLVDDLLDVSAIVSGRLRLTPAVINLDDVVRDAVDAVRLSLESRQQTLALHLEPLQMLGDADRLRQVIWNLLSNAVKFTPDGGQITLRLERDGPLARVFVRDTGRGIRPEFLPHVFEPFRQADASITRASGGLGLGLALVRHLVEAHGGSVHAASAGARQGSVFTVTLPIQGVMADADVPAFEASPDADADAGSDVHAAARAAADPDAGRDTSPSAAPSAASHAADPGSPSHAAPASAVAPRIP